MRNEDDRLKGHNSYIGRMCVVTPIVHPETNTPQASFMRGENGKLGGGGTIGRNGNGHTNPAAADAGVGPKGTPKSDSLNLPWLLSLAKTTALLAGKMASTVVVGDSGVSPFLEKYYRSPMYSTWLESDLMKGGCNPSYQGLMLAPLNITSRAESPNVRVPVAGNTPDVSLARAVRKASDGTRSRVRLDDFLEGVASGNGQGGLLVAWLAEGLAPSNTAYRIVKRQAAMGQDGKALARAERAMMAALLRHGGLDGDAALFSVRLEHHGGDDNRKGSREPPRRLAALWKSTAEVCAHRHWYLFCRRAVGILSLLPFAIGPPVNPVFRSTIMFPWIWFSRNR